MKKHNVIKSLILPLLVMVLIIASQVQTWALTMDWTNSDNDYQAIIEDDAGLIKSPEYVMHFMQPITAYGNVMLKTIDQNSYSAGTFAEQTLHNTFGTTSATIFLIDMANRKIYIFSDGAINRTITSSKAEVITDNIYRYASGGNYDECAAQGFQQIETLLDGGRIAEPMHIIGIALISLLIGMIVCFILMSGVTRKKQATARELIEGTDTAISISQPELTFLKKNKKYDPVQTSGGGISGGGGGFSGGGGGGGGSGSGGGHSF